MISRVLIGVPPLKVLITLHVTCLLSPLGLYVVLGVSGLGYLGPQILGLHRFRIADSGDRGLNS